MTIDPEPRRYSLADAEKLLRSRFGYDGFRSGQREAIDLLLSDHERPGIPPDMTGRALAVFPTGSGKSMCYQLPALLFSDGLTLVVSPLMALMKDQVDSLVKRDVPAACLDSSLSAAETRELYDRIAQGDLSILFVSPERFNNSRFISAIRKVPLALLAIDEAHCISEWGHSFRPDYLRLSRWADRLAVRRRLALTATATPAVAEDICRALAIPYPAAQVRTPSVRNNLTTRVTLVPSASAGARNAGGTGRLSMRDVLLPRVDMLAGRLAERAGGPTIVYVSLQTTATMVAEMLRERGFQQAMCYHGGMRQDERKSTQDAFMGNLRDALVVATIAFGMGMDHSSIRYVYHLNAPKTLEGYIQEIGRAGRDGLPSVCESLVSVDDIPTLEGFIYGETPAVRNVRLVLDKLFGGADRVLNRGDEIVYSTYDLAYECDIRDTCLGQLLAQLDLSESVMEETTPFYSVLECKLPLDVPQAQRRQPAPNSPSARVIAAAGGFKRTQVVVDTLKIAQELGMEYGRISRLCDDMVADGVFREIKARKLMHRARLTKVPASLDKMAARLHGLLVKSQDRQISRLADVVRFYSSATCQTRFLAHHLGDDDADIGGDGVGCGHCEVCVGTQVPVPFQQAVDAREQRPLDQQRWAAVCGDDVPKDDPLLLARFAAGITSPVIARKFRKLQTYGSMDDHDFNVLLQAAHRACGDNSSV